MNEKPIKRAKIRIRGASDDDVKAALRMAGAVVREGQPTPDIDIEKAEDRPIEIPAEELEGPVRERLEEHIAKRHVELASQKRGVDSPEQTVGKLIEVQSIASGAWTVVSGVAIRVIAWAVVTVLESPAGSMPVVSAAASFLASKMPGVFTTNYDSMIEDALDDDAR